MRTPQRSLPAIAAAMVVLSVLACRVPGPTVGPPPDTVTPYAAPTVPPSGDEPTPPPPGSETPGSPTEPPPPPTEPPPSSWLPEGTFALYASGGWEGAQLYALTPGPTLVDLRRTVTPQTSMSRTGRWIAHGIGSPATSITIINLETGTTHTIPLTSEFVLYGSVFDLTESRLAFMELGGSGIGTYTWAIVVVNLADGSTTRFEKSFTSPITPGDMLPGRPFGWSAAGNELLLDSFLPESGGFFAGVWAVTIPPGTPSAALDTMGRREMIAAGDYSFEPRMSPDGTQMLYLRLEPGYTPAGYTPMGPDYVVNQLWGMDLATGTPSRLVNVDDGGALARDAAWMQEVPHTVFAQGNYAGGTFASLTLKVRDGAASVRDVGAVPLPTGGDLIGLDGCRPSFALATVVNASYEAELHIVDFGGGSTLVTSAPTISVLGCVP
jgi:hypothetical protein